MFVVRTDESTQCFMKISIFISMYKESSPYLASKRAINQSSENICSYDTHPRSIFLTGQASICKMQLVKNIDLFTRHVLKKSSTNAMSVFQISVFAITHAAFNHFAGLLESYNSHSPVATKFFNNHRSTWSTNLSVCYNTLASITFIYK